MERRRVNECCSNKDSKGEDSYIHCYNIHCSHVCNMYRLRAYEIESIHLFCVWVGECVCVVHTICMIPRKLLYRTESNDNNASALQLLILILFANRISCGVIFHYLPLYSTGKFSCEFESRLICIIWINELEEHTWCDIYTMWTIVEWDAEWSAGAKQNSYMNVSMKVRTKEYVLWWWCIHCVCVCVCVLCIYRHAPSKY